MVELDRAWDNELNRQDSPLVDGTQSKPTLPFEFAGEPLIAMEIDALSPAANVIAVPVEIALMSVPAIVAERPSMPFLRSV